MKLQEIIQNIQSYHPDPNLDPVKQAYHYVRNKHQGQTRASGEPYVNHVTEVAFLATKLKLDISSIVTCLLHDTVEDTSTTLEEIEEKFGKEVSELVDGVTKLSQVKFSSREEQQAENFRKMLLAMAKDIRVLLIKLCDRTHNMRTLGFLSEARRLRIAQETLDIYAPLAHRLGIHWMKSEFEDLALSYLRPEIYQQIKTHINKTRRERERYTEKTLILIKEELKKNEIEAEVSGRPKQFYSIFRKMQQQNLQFDELHDITAFRIIVENKIQCYGVLGVIHSAWKPIPGRFKDYIAMAKANKYQSLHTTVIGPLGERIEIQIRTKEMHEIAERGIAAHWMYKETKGVDPRDKDYQIKLDWIAPLLESEKHSQDPLEFISNIKNELFPEEVFVFTPKGEVLSLPRNSTPIDFGFHIHSEIGLHCNGARVNGQQVPLHYQLRNGDTVEVIASQNQTPSKDWLNFIASTKAKQKIRAWLKNEERERSISVGKELLNKHLRKVKLSISKIEKSGELEKVAKELGLKSIDILFAEVGYGKISTMQIIVKLLPDDKNIDEKLLEDSPNAIQRIFQKAAQAFREKAGVKISGQDDVVFRFAKCCDPLPGDEVVGYISRGRGVAVHKRRCPETLSFDPRRLVAVTWDDSIKTMRHVRIQVHTADKVGILANLTKTISSNGVNISSAYVGVNPDGKALCTFNILVENAGQVATLTKALQKLPDVLRVERTMQKVKEGS